MSRGEMRAKIRLEGDSSGATKAISDTERGLNGLVKRVKANWLQLTALSASLVGAFRLVKSSAEQAGQATAFQQGLAAQGVAADEFIAKLRKISDSQIANADLVLATNRAIALGIKAEDIPGLLETAAQASVRMGISVTQAFNDITTGVGRASPLILDNLGIVIDSERIYAEFAESIGIATEQLTKQQRTAALTKAVMANARDETKKFTDVQDELTRSINRSAAALENMKQATGTLLGGLSQMVAGGLVAFATAISLVQEALIKTVKSLVAVGRLIPGINSAWKGWADTLQRWDDEMDVSQRRLAQLAIDLSVGGYATVQVALGFEQIQKKASLAAPAVDAVNEAVKETAAATGEAAEGVDDLADGFSSARNEVRGLGYEMHTARSGIQAAGQQAITTARQFDQLAESAGRAAAVAAALAGGGTLTQGGTRLQLPGHGSRLVNTSGRTYTGTEAYSLSQFGTGGRVAVDSDGSIRPA